MLGVRVAPWLGYTRVSRVGERAETLVSPELQAERIRTYAAARKLSLEMLEAELDVSGGDMERPILSEAIASIERGEAAGIIVAQLDRLSRAGILETHRIIQRVEVAGGKVIAVAENFDDATPEGRMGRNVMLALGEMQLDRVRLGFEQARRQAVERGIWPAPYVPLGYRRGPERRLVPDGPSVVRRAFEARAAGEPWTKVGRILGRGPQGAQILIRNRVYLGEVGMMIAGALVRNSNAHPAIVPRSLWEAAQLHYPRPPKGKGGPALLAGLVRCAGCRRLMTPSARAYNCVPSNNAAGRCPAPASINRGPIEKFVCDAVLAALRVQASGKARTDQTEQASQTLAEAEAELAAYQRAMSVADLGAEHFAVGMRQRVEAVEEGREELGRARGRSEGERLIAEPWEGLGVMDRRHVLRSALDVVWVRSSGKRTVPITERVKLIASGHGPSGLGRGGNRRLPIASVKWDELPGEVGVQPAEDLK
jgi:DNA invertase Pin-like site-specific DNA recombinase